MTHNRATERNQVYAADKSYAASLYAANQSAAAHRYAADRSYAASTYASQMSSAASKYASDTSAKNAILAAQTSQNVADTNFKSNVGSSIVNGSFGLIRTLINPLGSFSDDRATYTTTKTSGPKGTTTTRTKNYKK